jgi:hypothetical protein
MVGEPDRKEPLPWTSSRVTRALETRPHCTKRAHPISTDLATISAATVVFVGVKVRKVAFLVSELSPEVRVQFVGVAAQNENRDGLSDLIGTDRFFNHLEDALVIAWGSTL